jgi:hypothetical protein
MTTITITIQMPRPPSARGELDITEAIRALTTAIEYLEPTIIVTQITTLAT